MGRRGQRAWSRKGAERAPPREKSLGRRIWQEGGFLAVGIALALLIRAMVIETFYVPSESMLPTLLIGDHVVVNKFAYGARIPFVDLRLPALREPRRGEVIIFDLGWAADGRICPLDRCPGASAEGFVKRLVGLPGDRVEVRDSTVWVNGERLGRRFEGERFRDESGELLAMGWERLGGREHGFLDHPGRPGLEQPPVVVPEGRYFVMGDNRDNSNDSRAWGTVPRTDVRGPVMRIYWSWNNQGSWLSMLNPITWWRLLSGETRWHRIGDDVR